MGKEYRIVYTESALRDLEEKADYISLDLREPALAEKWYLRLRAGIMENLTCFPYKYPLCRVEAWAAKGVRQFAFRNDVILYSVDEPGQLVYIRAVCTGGRDLGAHLDDRT